MNDNDVQENREQGRATLENMLAAGLMLTAQQEQELSVGGDDVEPQW